MGIINKEKINKNPAEFIQRVFYLTTRQVVLK